MFPAFAHFRRTATRDTELNGTQIKEGEKVVMWYVSSNRDETRYEDPDRFDVHRNPEHQAFGAGGRHFCLGTALARLELEVLIEETLRRYPRIELDGEPGPPNPSSSTSSSACRCGWDRPRRPERRMSRLAHGIHRPYSGAYAKSGRKIAFRHKGLCTPWRDMDKSRRGGHRAVRPSNSCSQGGKEEDGVPGAVVVMDVVANASVPSRQSRRALPRLSRERTAFCRPDRTAVR